MSPLGSQGRCLSQVHKGSGRVHPWINCQLIAGPYVSIWRYFAQVYLDALKVSSLLPHYQNNRDWAWTMKPPFLCPARSPTNWATTVVICMFKKYILRVLDPSPGFRTTTLETLPVNIFYTCTTYQIDFLIPSSWQLWYNCILQIDIYFQKSVYYFVMMFCSVDLCFHWQL